MIINLDDVNYAVHTTQYDTIEEAVYALDICWFIHIFSRHQLKSRLLDVEPLIDYCANSYYISNFLITDAWPEMEEKFRQYRAYKSWYEQQTGRRI